VLPPPELVIDECIDKRLATELKGRGRLAQSVSGLGLRGLDDPVLFQELAKLGHPYVIVTADTSMPFDWLSEIQAAGTTVAVIDSRRSEEFLESQWYRDVVRRWAHVMRDQPQGSIHRYSAWGHRPWRPKKRLAPG
jgi:hypothetical protein